MSKIIPYTTEEHRAIAAHLRTAESELNKLLDYLNSDGHRIPVSLIGRTLKVERAIHPLKCAFRDEMEKNSRVSKEQDWYFGDSL